MSLQIRPATSEDLYAVVGLLQSRTLPVAGFADLLRAQPEHVRIAELNGLVVGSAALDVREGNGLLRSVAVAHDLASLGVGTRLVNDLIAQARQADLTALYLLTTTAAAWFPKFGFTVTDRSAVPAALRPRMRRSSGARTAPMSSLRMQTAMAVSKPGRPGRTERNTGSTAAAGGWANSRISRPISAFAPFNALQGVVPAKQSRTRPSQTVQPPGLSAAQARPSWVAVRTMTSRAKTARLAG